MKLIVKDERSGIRELMTFITVSLAVATIPKGFGNLASRSVPGPRQITLDNLHHSEKEKPWYKKHNSLTHQLVRIPRPCAEVSTHNVSNPLARNSKIA
jgi:hypothetical protein